MVLFCELNVRSLLIVTAIMGAGRWSSNVGVSIGWSCDVSL